MLVLVLHSFFGCVAVAVADIRTQRCIVLFLVVNDQLAVVMSSHEKVLRARDPFDKAHGRRIHTAVLVDPGIPLRDRLVPDDIARRRPHHNIYMRRTLGDLVDIVTQHMRPGEEDLGQRLLLLLGAQIEPLECAIDVGEREQAFRVPITQPFLHRLVGDHARDKRRAALDDVVLGFAPLEPVFHRWA